MILLPGPGSKGAWGPKKAIPAPRSNLPRPWYVSCASLEAPWLQSQKVDKLKRSESLYTSAWWPATPSPA